MQIKSDFNKTFLKKNIIDYHILFRFLSIIIIIGIYSFLIKAFIDIKTIINFIMSTLMYNIIICILIFPIWLEFERKVIITIFFIILLISHIFSFFISLFEYPINKKSHTMIINSYIEKVLKDNENSKFIHIDFKEPFEKKLNVNLSSEKFVKIFLDDKKRDKFFKLEATKSCILNFYNMKRCETILKIYHKHIEEPIGKTLMTNSIYPKKISFKKEKRDD